MKQLIKNYTFNKATKQITFTDYSTVYLERILLITDVTNNTVVYQFNNSALAGSISSGNILTLTYNTNTGSFSNSDALQIMYDSAAGDPLYDLPQVTGNIASGATDSGNPVKVGGVYNSALPSPSSGQRVDLQVDSSGRLIAASQLYNGTTLAAWGANNVDTIATSSTANKLTILSEEYIYNGSTYDRVRSAPGVSGTTGTGALAAGAMGIYNTSAPTASNGDYYPLQLDSSANLKVNVVAGASNTQYAELATTTSATGTLSLGRYQTSLPTLTNNQMNEPMLDSSSRLFVNVSNASLAVTESGTWTVATNADAAIAAGSAPSKALVGGAVYNSTEISPSTGQTFALQGDSKGRLRNVLMDGAGNTRAANVTASNELLVNVNNASLTVAQATAANLNANVFSGISTGSAVPATAYYMGISDGTNMRGAVQSSAASGTTGTGLLGTGSMGIYNTSAPTASNGDYYPLQLDSSANLKVNVAAGSITSTDTNAQTANATAAWTSGSGTTSLTVTGLSGYGSVMVSYLSSGTITGGQIVFEAYDGTNWWSLPLIEVNNYTGTVEAFYSLATGSEVWRGNIAAFQQFRVRLSSAVVGSGTANIIIAAMAASFVTGTVTQQNAANLNVTEASASGIATSVSGLSLGQGSTTSGQKGALTMGAVTTSAPSYSNGQTSPVSIDTTGNLRTLVTNTTLAVTESGTWTVGTNADASIGAGSAPSKALVGGAVYNSTEISPSTGQTFALQGDSKGRLRNVIMDGAGNTRGANVNSSNQLSVIDAASSTTGSGVPSAATYLGVSDGSNLRGAVQSSAASGTTGIGLLGAGAMGIYNTSAPTAANGDYYPLQLDSSANLKVNVAAGGLSGSSSSVAINDGTNTANVITASTAQSTGNALLTAITGQSASFTSSITSGTANLASTDAGNYNIVAVQITGLGTGGASLAFQGSNDNSNWYAVPLNRNSVLTASPFTSTTSADMYTGGLPYRYFRVQLSSQTGGTTSGVVFFKTGNYASQTIGGQVALNGTSSVNMAQVNGSTISLGNTTMSASLPVTLASNDTNTTPFVTSGGGGYIRQDSTATIAKESGGNLATIAGLSLAQASTTSGQKGTLTMGAVTTSAPSYATSQTSPLSLDTSGNLRTSITNASITVAQSTAASLNATVAQSGTWTVATNADAGIGAGTAPSKALVSGAVYNSTEISPTNGQTFALQGDSKGRLRNVLMDGAGNTRAANVTASNELLVNVNNASLTVAQATAANLKTTALLNDGSGNAITSTSSALDVNLKTSGVASLAVGFTDTTATGNITTQNLNPNSGTATAGSTVATAALNGKTTASIQVVGTYTGALSAQASVDGSNWTSLGGVSLTNINTGATTPNIVSGATGIWQADVAGFNLFRMSALSAITGTATISIQVSNGSSSTSLDAPIPTGANTIGAITQSGTWTVATNADAGIGAGTAPSKALVGGAVYNSTEISPTNGQTFALQGDSKGRLRNVIMDAAGNTRGANVTASNELLVNVNNASLTVAQATAANLNATVTQTGTWTVQPGNTANTTPWLTTDSADKATGNAVPSTASYGGAQAITSLPTAASNANIVGISADKFGRQVVIPYAIRDITATTSTSTATGSVSPFIAQVASTFVDIASIVFGNSSATATLVTLSDGSKSYYFYVPAGDTRGASYNVPLPATNANTAWTLTINPAVTTMYITATYIQNK